MFNFILFAHAWAITEPKKTIVGVCSLIFLIALAAINSASLFLIAAFLCAMTMIYFTRIEKNGYIKMALFAISLMIFMAPEHAYAAGGLASWAQTIKSQLGDIYDAGIYAAYGSGLFATYIGINNGIKKSKGDQQVTNASIFGYGIGGPILMMLGYAASTAAETIGGGVGQMNRLP